MEGTLQNKEKQLETRTDTSGVSTRIVFGTNDHFAYVYKKTEKLATAVYMITDFIGDSEPLKHTIRELVLSLTSITISLTTVPLSERKNLLKKFQARALEVVSLSGIAFHAGLVSEMNFSVISREFGGLISRIDAYENKRVNEETVVFDSAFFDTPAPTIRKEDTMKASVTAPVFTPTITGPSTIQTEAPRTELKQEYLPVKDIPVVIKDKPQKTLDSKDNRQAIIIKLLSKKSGLSVTDFEDSIKGVSTKTIQRELLSMVASGVLKKEGERRWSTYSLA